MVQVASSRQQEQSGRCSQALPALGADLSPRPVPGLWDQRRTERGPLPHGLALTGLPGGSAQGWLQEPKACSAARRGPASEDWRQACHCTWRDSHPLVLTPTTDVFRGWRASARPRQKAAGSGRDPGLWASSPGCFPQHRRSRSPGGAVALCPRPHHTSRAGTQPPPLSSCVTSGGHLLSLSLGLVVCTSGKVPLPSRLTAHLPARAWWEERPLTGCQWGA